MSIPLVGRFLKPGVISILLLLFFEHAYGAPDLYPSLSLDPGGSGPIGTAVTITATTVNGGDTSAGTFTNRIYYAPYTNPSSKTTITEYQVSSLGPGSSHTKTATFTCTTEGIFLIGFEVDINSQVSESNENNNNQAFAFGCYYPKPNLKTSLYAYPTSAYHGQKINITISTYNNGERDANSSVTGLNETISGSTSLIALFNISSLPPGGSQTIVYNYTCDSPSSRKSITLVATADYYKTVNESSEDDNKASLNIFCNPPPTANYSCSISPSSATIPFSGSQNFTINCFSNSTSINCSNITSSFTISAPSFISINKTSLTTFTAKPTSTAQGGDSGVIVATATLSNGSTINCSANISIANTVNASCTLPSPLTLPINTTVKVNVSCFNGSQPINCTSALLQPFAWSIQPTSSPYITIITLDSYATSANITATQPDTNKSLLVSGKDLDNNLFSCTTPIVFNQTNQTTEEKCLILPVSFVPNPPSIKYEARCIDYSKSQLRNCKTTHLLKVIGPFNLPPSPSLSAPLIMLGAPPYAGFLIVSTDGLCSSFFHPIYLNPFGFPTKFPEGTSPGPAPSPCLTQKAQKTNI